MSAVDFDHQDMEARKPLSEPKIAADPTVALERCSSYAPEQIDRGIESLLSRLGGFEELVGGREVLLKPNLLMPKKPEQAVTTHPQLIRAVAKVALDGGAKRVCVADSPAVGKAKWVASRMGLQSLLDPLGAEIEELTEEVEVACGSAPSQKLKLSKRVMEAEVLINLAKLKSHGLCGMTMAVKNCYGAIVGLDKMNWHLKAGRNSYVFAAMLVDVCKAVAPALSIVDAVESMDQCGPSAGRVRKTGFLAAGRDPFSLDRVLAAICQVCPDAITTFAHDGAPDLDRIRIKGASIQELAVTDWCLPTSNAGGFLKLVSRFFPSRLARSFGPEPRFVGRLCTLCQQCIKICPAKALSERKKKIKIDKDLCIRCFCCQETCPEGAIRVARGWSTKR